MSGEKTVAVIGGGAWGTALASMLAMRDGRSLLWARNADTVEEINTRHTNSHYLANIDLPQGLTATQNIADICAADIILSVTPAQSFAKLAQELSHVVPDKTQIVLCAKGIDRDSGDFLNEIAGRVFGQKRIAALSGPSFAHDVAKGLPTAVSCAAASFETAQELAKRLSAPNFRIYASDDITGVEAGGALKNVLALAVGVARGLQLGASAEAALIARGFAEMSKLTIAIGGRSETLSGLSGLGDLVLSCSSPQSRNFSYGMAMAQGDSLSNLPLAEGAHSASQALALAKSHHISVPIIEAVNNVLTAKLSAAQAVQELLARPLRDETST
jgi:glycerol-3-phosphate dehydrogenase (NAD(P)+)